MSAILRTLPDLPNKLLTEVGFSVIVAVKNEDANGTRNFQRLLTGILETIGWAGRNAALVEAVEACTRDRVSGLQRTARALAAGSV